MRSSVTARSGLLGAVALLVLAGVWALLVPISGGPDESAHAVQAYSLVHGGILPELVDSAPPVHGPTSQVTVPEWVARLHTAATCWAFKPEQDASCAPALPDSDAPEVSSTSAGRYPPPYYAVAGAPSLVLRRSAAALTMRLASLLVAAGLLALALASLRRLGSGWPRLAGLLLALTPMVAFLSGLINPSGWEIPAAIALWLALEAAAVVPEDDLRAAATNVLLSGAALVVSRPAAIAFLAGIAVIVVVRHGWAPLARLWRQDPATRGRLLTLGGIVVALVGWLALADTFGTFRGIPPDGLTTADIIRTSARLTARRLHEMVGVFGWLDAPTPQAVVTIWLGATSVLVALALLVGRWRDRIALVLVVAGTLLLPIVMELRTAAEIGFAWQGRYTLPAAVGIPLLAGLVVSERRPRLATPAWPIVALAGTWAGLQAISAASALRRFAVGVDVSLASFVRMPEGDWSPLLGTRTTLALAVVASGAAAALLATAAWPRRPVSPADAIAPAVSAASHD